MERRLKKYDRQLSPDRAKVWTEKSPKYYYSGSSSFSNHRKNRDHGMEVDKQRDQQKQLAVVEMEHNPQKVASVVYYLCRNQQLEHPHFLEVTLSSPDGLYLRDIIERLNVLRGRGMASKYSWSCKRTYKNGYVWHDLCEDDLILSVQGHEYVLKGSELFEESTSIGCLTCLSPVEDDRLRTPKTLPEPPSSRSQVESSSSSTMSRRRVTKHLPDDEPSPPAQHPCSSSVSPESSVGKNSSWNGSLSLTEYKIYKSDGQADASTQTDEYIDRASGGREISTGGDCSLENESSESQQNRASIVREASKVCQDSVSPACSSSASSSGGRADTFESLIRSDASKFNRFRILQQEEVRAPSSTKMKASNMLMQLISCGSSSVKDNSFGLTPSYKSSFLHSRFLMLGDVDYLSENPHFTGLKLEDKEYFSGNLVETNTAKEGTPTFKLSPSCNEDGSAENQDPDGTPEELRSMGSKCIPQAIKASLLKQPRSESMRSPLSDGPRISSSRIDCSRNISSGNSSGRSERFTGPTSTNKQSKKSNLLKNEERMIKIEERLASGARVIIQSKAESDNEW